MLRKYVVVSTVDPSSAMIISQSGKVWAYADATASSRNRKRLKVGRMIDTVGMGGRAIFVIPRGYALRSDLPDKMRR